jgi:hypothetical protein
MRRWSTALRIGKRKPTDSRPPELAKGLRRSEAQAPGGEDPTSENTCAARLRWPSLACPSPLKAPPLVHADRKAAAKSRRRALLTAPTLMIRGATWLLCAWG